MSRFRYVLGLGVGAIVLLGLVTVLGRIFPYAVEFNPAKPVSDTPELEAIEAPISSLVVPFSVDIQFLEDAINELLPMRGTESEEVSSFPRIDLVKSWQRTDLTLAGDQNELLVETNATFTMRLRLSIGPSVSVDIGGRVKARVRPVIEPNWRVSPDIDIEIQNPKFSTGMLGTFRVPDLLGDLIAFLEKKFESNLARDLQDFLQIKDKASEVWASLCTSIPVSQEPAGWLEVTPLRFHLTQPAIYEEIASLQFGLDVGLRLGDDETTPTCVFPEQVHLQEQLPDPEVHINLPAYVKYDSLTSTLKTSTVGKHRGENIVVTVENVDLRPYGESILLDVDLSVAIPRLFGTRATGKVYILGNPTVDPQASTLTIADVRLNTASRNIVLDLVGEVAERQIANIFDTDPVFSLQPIEEMLADQANSMLKALSGEPISITGKVDDVSFERLDIGPNKIRVVSSARATVAVAIADFALPSSDELEY